jgi:hypothetical protein
MPLQPKKPAITHILGHVLEVLRKTAEYPGFDSRRPDQSKPSKNQSRNRTLAISWQFARFSRSSLFVM